MTDVRPRFVPFTWTPGRKRAGVAVAVVAAVIAYYELGNLAFKADVAVADAHGLSLWALEQRLGIAVEGAVQAVALDIAAGWPGFLWVMSLFYVIPHFLVTFALYAYLAWRQPVLFARYRNVLTVSTVLAFGFQWVYPMSPPWLLPDETGIVYTLSHMQVNGDSSSIRNVTNAYAALPSVHTLWAVLSAWYGAKAAPRWAWAWWTYAVLVLVNIVATGNHFFLDMVAIAPFVALGVATDRWLRKGRSTRASSATDASDPGRAAGLAPPVAGQDDAGNPLPPKSTG